MKTRSVSPDANSSKRTYKNISNSTYFNDIVQTLKTQKLKSAFEINLIQTRSLMHIFGFLTKLLFRYHFSFSADKRRQPLLGARGKRQNNNNLETFEMSFSLYIYVNNNKSIKYKDRNRYGRFSIQ